MPNKQKKVTRRVNGREKKGISGNAVKYITSARVRFSIIVASISFILTMHV